MRYIATIIVAALLPFTFSTPAEADGKVGTNYSRKDVCKNVKGRQTILDVVQGTYQFKNKSKRICVKGWR
jgi:hypothetical protein